MNKDVSFFLNTHKWLYTTLGMHGDCKSWYFELLVYYFYNGNIPNNFNDILKIVSCEIDRFCTITILPFINDRTQVITEDVLYRLQKIIDYTSGELCTVELLRVIYTTY